MKVDALKQQLLEKQAVLTKRIDAIKTDFASGRSADFSEQATETENDEVLVQLKSEAEQELRDVHRALEKINRGGYGSCERCSCEIQTARLEALPDTRCCIQCAA